MAVKAEFYAPFTKGLYNYDFSLSISLIWGGRVVRSLLQLSEIWPRHIWLTGRMKFASLDIHSTLNWPIVKSEKLKIEYFRFDI